MVTQNGGGTGGHQAQSRGPIATIWGQRWGLGDPHQGTPAGVSGAMWPCSPSDPLRATPPTSVSAEFGSLSASSSPHLSVFPCGTACPHQPSLGVSGNFLSPKLNPQILISPAGPASSSLCPRYDLEASWERDPTATRASIQPQWPGTPVLSALWVPSQGQGHA